MYVRAPLRPDTILLAMSSALVERSLEGGLVIVADSIWAVRRADLQCRQHY